MLGGLCRSHFMWFQLKYVFSNRNTIMYATRPKGLCKPTIVLFPDLPDHAMDDWHDVCPKPRPQP